MTAGVPRTGPPARAVFAIPGDIDTVTGGYIYERSLLHALRAAGREVTHLQLPGSFPDAPPNDMAATVSALAAIPPDTPLILDGLVFGAIETAGLDRVRAPVVAMIHHPLGLESGLSAARAHLLVQRETENLARAAHVVVPSPHTATILRTRFGVAADRMSIAPPGFRQPGPSQVARAQPPLILSVGILHPRKGHDTLLDALAGIAGLCWRAEIVGAPHDRDHAAALHRQRADLGLGGRVGMPGVVDAEALETLYRSATIFALATRYEGYGMVLSEALMHALPVVACRTGAVPDTVPAAAGILVPPDAPEAFAAALHRMLTDDGLRARSAAAALRAGQALPRWTAAAAVMGRALDAAAIGAQR